VPAVDAVRCWTAGRAFCAWLSGVALSVFERAGVRLRVGAGCACSFAPGVSDVSLMKKTPFYLSIHHGSFFKAWRKSLFTATKKDCRLPLLGRDRPSRWSSARHYIRLRSKA
jgi:hypothetical protein